MTRMPRALVLVVRLACRLVPAGMLLWAGLAKAFDRQGSILAVDAYDVLPEGLVRLVAAVLPWTEIGVALLLIAGLFVRFAGALTALLGAAFVVGMAQAKARGLQIECGCFGGGGAGDGVSWLEIVRDLPLVVGGIALAVWPRGPLQLDNRFLDGEVDDGGGDGAVEEAAQAGAPALRR
jgi:uncharacterized membrane protein YphA (DoxX/SURF4 family)